MNNKANRITAGILAILLGGLGIHQFYTGHILKGLLYLVFCWTFIPAILGLLEGILILVNDDTWFNKTYLNSVDHSESLSYKAKKEESSLGKMLIGLVAFIVIWKVMLGITDWMNERSDNEIRERQNAVQQARVVDESVSSESPEPIEEVDPNKPTQQELAIRKRISDLHVELNSNSNDYVSEAEVYKILAPELGMTDKELEGINWKVADYYLKQAVYDF